MMAQACYSVIWVVRMYIIDTIKGISNTLRALSTPWNSQVNHKIYNLKNYGPGMLLCDWGRKWVEDVLEVQAVITVYIFTKLSWFLLLELIAKYSVADPFHFDMDPDPDPRIRFVK